MAQIPVERRPAPSGGGGAWWWVLVIAVIGLVVWLVYEWFDNDYYEDYGYVGTDAYLDDQAVTPDGTADGGFVGPGNTRTTGRRADTLTTLTPVLEAPDPADFDGADVRLEELPVSRVLRDAVVVDVDGQDVLVVFDGAARRVAGDVTEGSLLTITRGEVHAIDDLDEPQRYGVSSDLLRERRFYLEAEGLNMAG